MHGRGSGGDSDGGGGSNDGDDMGGDESPALEMDRDREAGDAFDIDDEARLMLPDRERDRGLDDECLRLSPSGSRRWNSKSGVNSALTMLRSIQPLRPVGLALRPTPMSSSFSSIQARFCLGCGQSLSLGIFS